MRLLLSLLALLAFGAAATFAVVMGLYAYYAQEMPSPDQLAERRIYQTARIFDRHGELLQEIVHPEGGRRTLVPLADIPPVLRQATIAAEDASFYANPGFDPRAILRATYQWVRHGSPQSGASTITQQLVKNTLLGPEQTAERKIKEAFLALELTRRYSKDEILEMYLNEIFYGSRAYGVEAAAETYFQKRAGELTLAEASFLAGLPQAPAYYDPYTHLAAAKDRQRYVLDQMVRTAVITPEQADAAFRAPLSLRPRQSESTTRAQHFAAYVRQLLEEQYGSDALYRGGLQVTTSLDLQAQDAAEAAARAHIETIRELNATNAALVALRPHSGEILAMLGSVDFEDPSIDGQVNVALAERQPGSTLKPFTYLAAFAKGWNPATVVLDEPTVFGGTYRPNNFDNRFRGPIRVREALAQSLNVPAVKALELVGIPDLLALVHRLGIRGLDQPERYGLSLTLGGGEVRLLDLTYAYAALANGGVQVGTPVPPERWQAGQRQLEPVAILKVTDHTGRVLYEYTPSTGLQVADPRLVYQITSILADDAARAPTYGEQSALTLTGRPAAAKTGTTDNFRDSWVVGYTPDLVTGVWVGNSDNSPMKGVLGARGAGEIWHAFMREALRETPATPFEPPAGVVEEEVCALSGLLATPECRDLDGTVRDVFVPGVNLPERDTWHQRLEVCTVNGKLVTPLVPANGREMRVFVAFPEPLRAWGAAHGYQPPPTERCDDVYRGDRKAEITAPRANEHLVAGPQVQVAGSAYVDDFVSYTLDLGVGSNPSAWVAVTDQRRQGVDHALLGVLETGSMAPGAYTLRLRVFDSLGNIVEGRASFTLAPAPTPTTAPTATPAATATRSATPTPAPAPAVGSTVGPQRTPTSVAPTPASPRTTATPIGLTRTPTRASLTPTPADASATPPVPSGS